MGLFNKPKPQPGFDSGKKKLEEEIEDLKRNHSNRIDDMEAEHKREIAQLEADQAIALQEKNFEIKHLESEKVKTLEGEIVEAKKKIAVFEKQVEMLDRIVDLDADVIDVKDLVTQLINKLPEVKISGTVGGGSSKPAKE